MGNPTLISMFPASQTATVTVAGVSGSPFTATVTRTLDITVDNAAHAANGKTYDQITIQCDGTQATFTAGKTITITINTIN